MLSPLHVLDDGHQAVDVVRRKVNGSPLCAQRFNEQQAQLRLTKAIIVGLPQTAGHSRAEPTQLSCLRYQAMGI